MNTATTPALHLASEADDVPPMPDGVEPVLKVNGKKPHRFAVDRGNGLEPLVNIDDLDEARKMVKKQVVSSGTNVVYIYALVAAEVGQFTSVSLDIDQVEEHLKGM